LTAVLVQGVESSTSRIARPWKRRNQNE
jgi:hypothetical protein